MTKRLGLFTLVVLLEITAAFGASAIDRIPPSGAEKAPPAPPCPPTEDMNAAFRPGEIFEYKVRWGIFSEAARMSIAASMERSAIPRFRIFTTFSSRGFIRQIHPIDNQIDSLLDTSPWRVRLTSVSTSEGRRNSHVTTTLDYEKGETVVVDHDAPDKSRVKPLSSPCMLDIMSGVLAARALALQPGETRRLLLHEEGEEYLLTLEAQAVEKIKTPLGTFDALRLRPRMDFNPKGFFRRQGEMFIWFSRDSRRLPIQIQTKLKVGSAVAVLEKYTPAPPLSDKPGVGPLTSGEGAPVASPPCDSSKRRRRFR